MAEKKKFKIAFNVKNLIVLIVLIAIVVGYYISTSNQVADSVTEEDEYTVLVEKDLETSYPETPKEVVKLYGRLVKCLYKGDLSNKETKALVEQMRMLFDEELLEANSLEDQLDKLKEDVSAYESSKKSIINYEVDETTLVEGTLDNQECATIVMGFSIKKKKVYTRTNEQFLLKKDSEGLWKIVGWQLAEDESDSSETGESD